MSAKKSKSSAKETQFNIKFDTTELIQEPGTAADHILSSEGHKINIGYEVVSGINGKNNYYLKSIRIDEPGESTGSGHRVAVPNNMIIKLLTSYGHNNLSLKNGKNVIRIAIKTREPEHFVITKVKINNVNFIIDGNPDMRSHIVKFKEPKHGGKTHRKFSKKRQTRRRNYTA